MRSVLDRRARQCRYQARSGSSICVTTSSQNIVFSPRVLDALKHVTNPPKSPGLNSDRNRHYKKSFLYHSPFTNTMSDSTRALLKSNAKWAADVSEADPNFFPDSAKYPQKPHVSPLFLCHFL